MGSSTLLPININPGKTHSKTENDFFFFFGEESSDVFMVFDLIYLTSI